MASPVFNYKPIPRPGNGTRFSGGIRFEPTFPASGPINKALALARNVEVPEILRVAGELSPKEEADIFYTRLNSEQPVYVGNEGEEVYNGTWLDEKAVFALPTAGNNMEKLQKILLKRTGNSSDFSEMETILAGRNFTDKKPQGRRTHKLGFTITPDETRIGAAAINNTVNVERSNG